MHLGLDKLKFTTNFDRCAILNVLNCLTENFMPLWYELISTQKMTETADILFPIYGLLYIQIFYLRSHSGLSILRMWVRVQVTAPFFIIIITVRFQH